MSWKLSAIASRTAIEAALDRRDTLENWDETVVLTGFEVDPGDPKRWQLDAYCEARPTPGQRKAIQALFDTPALRLKSEKLPASDWISESQKGVDPIRAGRFHVRTPEHPAADQADVIEFVIPAAQAFGTGQHATTAGCLEMLDAMKRRGLAPRTIADIGTGTGLLAFAALAMWPRASVTASDIDPVCQPAVLANARDNGIALGTAPGALAMTVAEGMDDAFLQARAPYDLLIANILAGPLIELAPDFAVSVRARGSIVLAGLLETQESAVRAAYRAVGFRLQARLVRGDWSILWLRQRFSGRAVRG